MPYQGVAFAFLIGVAALVFLLKAQGRFQQPHSYTSNVNNGSYDRYSAGGSRSSSADERRRKRRSSSVDSCCVICQEEFPLRIHEVRILPCGHRFHFHCIDKWANTKRECPCCREEF